jgi:ketosteroid isomerase-like protein
MNRILLSTLLVALALPLQGAEPITPASAEDAMKKADLAMGQAVAVHDAARFASFLADDLVTFPRGELARGKDAMVKAWAPFLAAGGPAITWAPVEAHAAASADQGYTVGDFEIRSVDKDGKPSVARGHYVTIWRRHADGSWRAAVDIGTNPSPAAAAKPAP